MKVVLIGDSIRQGYQPLVIKKLLGKADVWGPEQNCRHSLWALDHFQEWVAGRDPDVVHFNFGIHDAVIDEIDGQFQIIPEQYKLCLQRFITRAKKLNAVLIWAASTPRYAKQEDVPMHQWSRMEEIDRYNRIAIKIVKENDLIIDPLDKIIMANDYTKCLKEDGCHMTDYGNQVLSEAVVKAVSQFI